MAFQDENLRAVGSRMAQLNKPWLEATELLLNHTERLAAFQLDVMRQYTHMGMRYWRDALANNNHTSLREYIERGQQGSEELTRRMAEDARTLARIGEEFTGEAQRIAERTARSLTELPLAVESREGGRAAERRARRAS